MSNKKRPESLGAVLAGWLDDQGLANRVAQAGIIPEWPRLVGPQIASVTDPAFVTADGTLFVHVTTNAWMNELSLMEPELLKALNRETGRPRVNRIRWQLRPRS